MLLGMTAIVMSIYIYGSHASFKRAAVETTASIVKIAEQYAKENNIPLEIIYVNPIYYKCSAWKDRIENVSSVSKTNCT